MTFHVPEGKRVLLGPLATVKHWGNNGAFRLLFGKSDGVAIASDGKGWEHVSVSLKNRTPTWAEMCRVKEMFWDEEDLVMQLHPPKSEWVNNDSFCLHLWRPTDGQVIPTPPSILVGIKELGNTAMTIMPAQPDLFALMDDPTFVPAPVLNYRAEPKPVLVTGWLKSYCGPALPAGAATTLATLNRIDGDGHRYTPCCFALKPGVSVEDYPGGFGLRGIRLKGAKLLISLYDAVQQGLATEVEE